MYKKINKKLSYKAIFVFISISLSLFSFFAFYPGIMTWDSLDQLRQARLGDYRDWQPPAMALLWHLFLMFDDGPSGMLIFQFFMIWLASILLYVWSTRSGHKFSFLFLCLPAFPWIINFQYVVWKDVGMAYSWILSVSIALLCRYDKKISIGVILVVFGFFFYGALIRSNSLVSAFFIIPFLIVCTLKTKKILALVGGTIFVFSFLFATNYLLKFVFEVKQNNPISYVMFDDLVALRNEGVKVQLSFLTAEDLVALDQCKPTLLKNKVGAAFCLGEKFDDVPVNYFDELKSVWVASVKANIIKYLMYRLDAFSILLSSPGQKIYYATEFRVVEAPYNVKSVVRQESAMEQPLRTYLRASQKTIPGLFKPYVWLLIAMSIVFLMMFRKKARDPWMALLPLSGVAYLFSYLPVTPAADFRYVYWVCVVTTVSLLIFINSYFSNEEDVSVRSV
ncbi:hypothetical protein [Pseudomonas gingeri]